MSDIDRIKEKLAKLLRLGEDSAASEGEIQNALNLATQLMAKHQLTREDIDTTAEDPFARVTMGRHFAFCKGTRASTWECMVAEFICEFIGSVSRYLTKNAPLRKNGIHQDIMRGFEKQGESFVAPAFCFYGSDDDARCAADMFEELRDAISTMAIVRYGGWARGEGMVYAFGFASGLREANRNSRIAMKNSDPTTTALVLQSEKNALAIVKKAESWLATAHNVKLAKGSSRSVKLGGRQGAYAEGRKDGSNYSVNRPQSRRKIG